MKRIARFVFAASALSLLAGAAPPRSVDDTPVALRFVDQPVVQVLEALFEATGARASIDPCATGRISIELRNVPMGTALDSIARIADLEVERSEGPVQFRVGCRRGGARRSVRAGEAVTLRFRLERSEEGGPSDTLAEPELRAIAGEPVEASEAGRRIPIRALAGDGENFATSSLPEWSLRVVVPRSEPGGSREVRGILEIARTLDRTPEPAVLTASRPFRVPMPEGAGEVEAARLDLGANVYVLWILAP